MTVMVPEPADEHPASVKAAVDAKSAVIATSRIALVLPLGCKILFFRYLDESRYESYQYEAVAKDPTPSLFCERGLVGSADTTLHSGEEVLRQECE